MDDFRPVKVSLERGGVMLAYPYPVWAETGEDAAVFLQVLLAFHERELREMEEE